MSVYVVPIAQVSYKDSRELDDISPQPWHTENPRRYRFSSFIVIPILVYSDASSCDTKGGVGHEARENRFPSWIFQDLLELPS